MTKPAGHGWGIKTTPPLHLDANALRRVAVRFFAKPNGQPQKSGPTGG